MSRLIKFRAWDGKYMIEWGFIGDSFAGPPSTNRGSFSTMKHMQFTGLHDKNGKEIFDGDVLKLDRYWQDHFNQETSVVFFHEGAFRLQHCLAQETAYTLSVVGSESEVIGNIYENPELLEFFM